VGLVGAAAQLVLATGSSRPSWLGPTLDPKEDSLRCGIPGLEAVLHWKLEFRNGVVKGIEMTGEAPPEVLDCLQKRWSIWPTFNGVGESSEGQLWLGDPGVVCPPV